MKKVFLALLLGASVVMADVSPKDDLLSVATAGKTTGTQFEMSKEDMKDADGGYYSRYISYTNPSSRYYGGTSRSYIYARAFLGTK
ncbi:MAG: hypothetical protein AABY36_03585 [Campylobacterota bacterium]